MAFVDINPAYRDLLSSLGLRQASQFLALPGVVVSGHPDRHVVQVQLGTGSVAVRAYLKREHRTSWKERLINTCLGLGFVSKSIREARILKAVAATGICCPDLIASGEDSRSRAFVLIRELTGFVDLPLYLRDHLDCGGKFSTRLHRQQRLHFWRHLGESVAELHATGFDHPDLFSKHILVHPDNGRIGFLDWQRSSRRSSLKARSRWRDLAALNASVGDHLITPRERIACLQAYLRVATSKVSQSRASEFDLRQSGAAIQRRTDQLRRRPRIRDMSQAPPATARQRVLWLDGEALCVTADFWDAMHGRMPAWLTNWYRQLREPGKRPDPRRPLTMPLPDGGSATLVRRVVNRPLHRLWTWLCRRTPISPEIRQAALLFRLQRQGIVAPRLLAFGQRHLFPWRTESFILTGWRVQGEGWRDKNAGLPSLSTLSLPPKESSP
jgi:tRNA A-37 threonylcarbamoyl transferase component Bud32